MAGSSAEREIRDAVVAHLRAQIPTARIIHELPMGGCRADLAAVTDTRVLAFEIKSRLDVLDRLDRQMRSFKACAHEAILVADIKWFDQTPYDNGHPRLAWAHGHYADVWCWPEPEATTRYTPHRWRIPLDNGYQPHPRRMMETLLKEELVAVAECAGVKFKRKMSCCEIRTHMQWQMTGEQIARGVCRELRARRFPEADAPIYAEAA